MVWHKTNPARKLRRARFLNSCELIVCAWNKGHTWNFGKENEMHNFIQTPICMGRERLKNPKHPTQKPVKVLEHLLKLGSKEGDLVFDPFMGVGSSGVAALNMKRQFLGFDKDATFVKAAGQRFRDACGMKVVPIKSGEAQPFLLTPSRLKLEEIRKFFAIAA
jgi:DNA modification methylase